ncbi:hypothetical protein QM012_002486 [Aureobasidium pullulans]|uniref:F-box domain-containing protein n=1 Tax=Aureobasidium pullulans TaxID=5580 RepID=A0ABR0TC27_AURPU
MSEGRREARREARRAESPPDPRDRRRRRLNSATANNLPHPTELVSSWLEQQNLTRSAVPAQTTPLTNSRTFPTPSHEPNSFIPSNPIIDQETIQGVASMRDQDTAMEDHDAGPSSSSFHPRALDADADGLSTSVSIDDRSVNSRRNGPLLNMGQIVSKNQSASAPADLQALSAADSDELSSETTEDSPVIGGVRMWPFNATASNRSTFTGNNATQSNQARLDYGGHFWDVVGQAIEDDRTAKKPTYPENPALLLAYQMDRSAPEPTLRFLPFIPVSQKRKNKSKNKRFMIQHSHKQRIDASHRTARRAQWVPGEFPVELFELINQYLSRDDIKSMRLVSKEFERGVSGSLFDTVVVPFNTELYEMIEQKVAKRDLKGKRRVDDPVRNFVDLDPGSLPWKNALEDTEDKVYRGHGLKVFEGFGHHIRRFGMSFEIKEDALQSPPQKNRLDSHESYFGSYEWPSKEYTRYELLAGLERTADETSQMKLAFSHLSVVQQLALSMDSGLGWMNGPDKSLRSMILQRPSPLFGCSHGIVDAQQQERMRLWEAIESAHDRLGALEDLKEGCLERVNLDENFFFRPPFSATPYASPALWATAPAQPISAVVPGIADSDGNDAPETGVLYISTSDAGDLSIHSTEAQRAEFLRKLDKFSPASLGVHQKEWLLEAEWAQRAFLTTYMLGVVDNSSVFGKVSVVNFRVSSHLVPLLSRQDFWTALPKLQEVTLAVIPDWRTVERDEAGIVETKDVDPSLAVEKTYSLLQDFIGARPNVTKLNFSWAAGGEHAEGIFARNHHVLPAPVTTIARSITLALKDDDLINLPHIKDLTFSNCWFTPISIVAMIKNLRKKSLKKIKFDSVSLTAMPRAPNVGVNPVNHANPNQNMFAPHQAPGPGVVMLGGNFAAQFGAQVWQGPPVGVSVQQWAQTMLQNLNAMTQQQGVALYQVPQIWTNHPMGMTMQQIHGMLTGLAAGNNQGIPPMAQPGMLYQLPQQQQQAGAAQFTQNVPPVAFPPPPPHPPAGWLLAPQPAVQAAPAPQPSNIPWYEGHRTGSWVNVIDKISPGPRLEMYAPRDEFEPAPEPRKKGLVSAEFKSCGYVQLRSPTFGDQNNIEAPASYRMSRHFIRRQSLLSPAMLTTQDKLLGTIVQYMSEHETDALHHAWGMTMGWSDAKLAEEAEYDGYLAGGTGRFSGSVTKDSIIQEAYSAQH